MEIGWIHNQKLIWYDGKMPMKRREKILLLEVRGGLDN